VLRNCLSTTCVVTASRCTLSSSVCSKILIRGLLHYKCDQPRTHTSGEKFVFVDWYFTAVAGLFFEPENPTLFLQANFLEVHFFCVQSSVEINLVILLKGWSVFELKKPSKIVIFQVGSLFLVVRFLHRAVQMFERNIGLQKIEMEDL